jgi:hypothetical protein
MLVVERKGENLASVGSGSSLEVEWADRSVPTGNPKTRTSFAELLIDCEEDRTLRAVPVGILRDTERGG